jgi:hypothetical protein
MGRWSGGIVRWWGGGSEIEGQWCCGIVGWWGVRAVRWFGGGAVVRLVSCGYGMVRGGCAFVRLWIFELNSGENKIS